LPKTLIYSEKYDAQRWNKSAKIHYRKQITFLFNAHKKITIDWKKVKIHLKKTEAATEVKGSDDILICHIKRNNDTRPFKAIIANGMYLTNSNQKPILSN